MPISPFDCRRAARKGVVVLQRSWIVALGTVLSVCFFGSPQWKLRQRLHVRSTTSLEIVALHRRKESEPEGLKHSDLKGVRPQSWSSLLLADALVLKDAVPARQLYSLRDELSANPSRRLQDRLQALRRQWNSERQQLLGRGSAGVVAPSVDAGDSSCNFRKNWTRSPQDAPGLRDIRGSEAPCGKFCSPDVRHSAVAFPADSHRLASRRTLREVHEAGSCSQGLKAAGYPATRVVLATIPIVQTVSSKTSAFFNRRPWKSGTAEVVSSVEKSGEWTKDAEQRLSADEQECEAAQLAEHARNARPAGALQQTCGKKTGVDPAVTLSRQQQILTFLSGGLAGTVAAAITTPIEVVKTHLQSSRGRGKNFWTVAKCIVQTSPNGAAALYAGLLPTLLGIIPTRSTYFWAYNFAKSKLTQHGAVDPDTPLAHAMGAAFAGILSNTVSNPIWMVKTRVQLLSAQPDATATEVVPPKVSQDVVLSYGTAIRQIYQDEGLRGFMKGLVASYWGLSETCINLVLYERLKKMIKRNAEIRATESLGGSAGVRERGSLVAEKSGSTPAAVVRKEATGLRRRFCRTVPEKVQVCLAAAVSKLIASSTTYPHEVARTRIREQAVNGVFRYTGLLQALRLTAKEEGFKRLYAGMGAHLMRVVPNNAILFLSYELINSWLQRYSPSLSASQRPSACTTVNSDNSSSG